MVFGNGVKNIQAAAYNGAHMVSSFEMIWLSLKTTLFIEPIKRVQIAAWNQGSIRTSGSVFELTRLFFLLVPALNMFLISMEGAHNPRKIRSQSRSSGIGIVSLRLTSNPTLEATKKESVVTWSKYLSYVIK